ncbi:MAG: hypothetical protein ABIP89_01745, partial [Polyangiaceae bacterium]
VEVTQTECPAVLVAARRGGTDADRYVPPNDAERAAMRDAAAILTANAPNARAEATARAATAGFDVIDVPEIPNAVLLRERDDHRQGGGAYLIRLDSHSEVVVQAPHTFFDEGTLPLGCELFYRAKARALFIDTAHRYKAAAQTEEGDHPADVAHSTTSTFHAMTEGVLRTIPHATVVQPHGFSKRDASVVVLSNGDGHPGDRLVERTAARLTKISGSGVKRYPEETTDLGATKNVQGAAVRAAGGRFLHVEMAAQLRHDLLHDSALRARFFDAISNSVNEK